MTNQNENYVLNSLPAPPGIQEEYDENRKRRIRLTLSIIFILIGSLTVFIPFFTFFESIVLSHSSTKLLNGTSIFSSPNSSCHDFESFLPLRWEMAAQPQVIMTCAWHESESTFRTCMSFVATVIAVLFSFSTFFLDLNEPRNAIITWSSVFSFVVVSFVFLIIAIVDGSSVSKGDNFCKIGMPEAAILFDPALKVNDSFGIKCHSEPFIGMVFSDVLIIVAFAVWIIYLFFYKHWNRKHGEPTIPPFCQKIIVPSNSETVPTFSTDNESDPLIDDDDDERVFHKKYLSTMQETTDDSTETMTISKNIACCSKTVTISSSSSQQP